MLFGDRCWIDVGVGVGVGVGVDREGMGRAGGKGRAGGIGQVGDIGQVESMGKAGGTSPCFDDDIFDLCTNMQYLMVLDQ